MGHSHNHHHHTDDMTERSLFWAILLNVALTVVQVIGGVVSGSLSLIADAVHNFSDAGALVVAYIAQKISGLSPDDKMTFGYGRAQILGALINSVALVFIGIYLLIEAWRKVGSPQKIDGWIVIWVAGVALVVDLGTAWLTFKGSEKNINLRAAFVHNLSDAMASVVCIVSGILILVYQIYWVDLVATVLISVYVLYLSFGLVKGSLKILMQAVPDDIDRDAVVSKVKTVDGVVDIHHIHIWEMNEQFRSMEAHVVVALDKLSALEEVKTKIKTIILHDFGIHHSTLEFEIGTKKCVSGTP